MKNKPKGKKPKKGIKPSAGQEDVKSGQYTPTKSKKGKKK